MVCEWGMSEEMGPLTFGKKEEQIFLGREIAQHQDYSEDTALRIDQEIKRFVTDNYNRARHLLESKRDILLKMADELLVREVLDGEQVKQLCRGESLDDRKAPASTETAPPAAEDRRPGLPTIVPPLKDPLPQQH
jgi:cell division protease FtsH